MKNIKPLKGLISLSELKIYNNRIENIEGLNGLERLSSLDLSNNKVENIEPLRGLTNLHYLYLSDNKIENVEALKELKNLSSLYLTGNKIENIEALNGLERLSHLDLGNNKIQNIDILKNIIKDKVVIYNEEINISPTTNKFNLPELKKGNGDVLDIVQASNGRLKKNEDGTYSFTSKVNRVQIIEVGKGEILTSFNTSSDYETWIFTLPKYILKIDPTNIYEENSELTKEIFVNGGDKNRLPEKIEVEVSKTHGLPKEIKEAQLNKEKTAYIFKEKVDKRTEDGNEIIYTVKAKTDIPNYIKKDDYYTYIKREVVNIPDLNLKKFLLKNLKKEFTDEFSHITLYDKGYIKLDEEEEIYRDEMEKIVRISLGRR